MYELANRVLVGSLAAGRRQAVQDGSFGVFEIRERQNPLRGLLLASVRLGHRRPASFAVADSFIEWPSLRRHSIRVVVRLDVGDDFRTGFVIAACGNGAAASADSTVRSAFDLLCHF